MTLGQLPNWFDRKLQRFLPTPIEVAQAELKDAQLHVLEAQTRAEYADLCMQINVLTQTYHEQRIERLQAFLGDSGSSMHDYTECPAPIEFKTFG